MSVFEDINLILFALRRPGYFICSWKNCNNYYYKRICKKSG